MAQTIIALLQKELEEEATATRRMLERIPGDRYDWKPHEKSMTMAQLATHIAELPTWITLALTTSELDFATTPYEAAPRTSTADVLALFEQSLADGRASLSQATDEALWPDWTLRNGEQVYAVMSKYETIRHSLAQMIHHRAQLGVYLRLLNIPIPGTYGPSADDMSF